MVAARSSVAVTSWVVWSVGARSDASILRQVVRRTRISWRPPREECRNACRTLWIHSFESVLSVSTGVPQPGQNFAPDFNVRPQFRHFGVSGTAFLFSTAVPHLVQNLTFDFSLFPQFGQVGSVSTTFGDTMALPHLEQNFAPGLSAAPHCSHVAPIWV